MSGPVFVVDNLGRPLMPLAEAHARKLLHSNRAQIQPHPTLTIIELNRVVERPTLQPIALSIVLHRTTAELFVAGMGPRSIFSLLYVVVDLDAPRVWRQKQIVGSSWGAQALDLTAAVTAFCRFIPLSHVIVLLTEEHTGQENDIAVQLEQHLASMKLHVTTAQRDSAVPSTVPADLFHHLVRFAAQPIMLPLIAVPFRQSDQPAHVQEQTSAASSFLIPSIGIVGNPPVTGILHRFPENDAAELYVATAVGPTRVVWERLVVEPQAGIQLWPVESVVLLPVSTVIAQPGVTRWNDYLYDQQTPGPS